MDEKYQPRTKEITMTAEDMFNICLILIENQISGLFMRVYEEEIMEVNEIAELAHKLRDIVIQLRETFPQEIEGGVFE